MTRKYRGALFNVGPIESDAYSGVHTYSQVLFPFINECCSRRIHFSWIGDGLVNSTANTEAMKALIRNGAYKAPHITKPIIEPKRTSADLLKADDFDFLLLQPRPVENTLEHATVEYLIKKFTDAKKRVFLFEQDMFPVDEKWFNNPHVTHLRPYTVPDERWKDSREFLFWHSPYMGDLHFNGDEVQRTFDFMYVGNVYGRQAAFQKFLGGLEVKNNAIFGNWMSSDAKREFSSQFGNLNFKGSTDHNYTIPLMNVSPFTLQILPEWAMEKGLMTARVFNAVSARTLCFVDGAIKGAERLFPPELVVMDGKELNGKIDYFRTHSDKYVQVMAARDKMMEDHSVERRVETFKKMLEELV